MFSKAWNHAALGASAVALSFGMAANANALDIGCYSTPTKIAQLKTQMANEGQMPIIKFYQSIGERGSETNKWGETIISMNPATKTGHRITKAEDGSFCVLSNMKAMAVYDNNKAKPDISAYINSEEAHDENSGINRIIHSAALNKKQLPMLRADEAFPQLKIQSISYILSNAATGQGQIAMSSHEGRYLEQYTRFIPSQVSANVQHGAIYTSIGKDILGQQATAASVPTR